LDKSLDKLGKLIWEKIKGDNSTILAILAMISTIIYAYFKFVNYMYWREYFRTLNMDANFMKMNYSGIFVWVFFIFVIIVLLIAILWLLNDSYINKKKKAIKEGNYKTFKKRVRIAKNIFLTTWLVFGFANILLLCFLFFTKISDNFLPPLIFLATLFPLIIILRDFKLLIASLFSVAIIAPGISSTLGSTAMEVKTEMYLVENEQYVITYNDGEKYILHKIQIKENKAIINRNEQKIIEVKDCEYITKTVNEVTFEDGFSAIKGTIFEFLS